MKTKFYFLILSIFSALMLEAQPLPCVEEIMTPQCADACVVCDIDGFNGRNTSEIPGQRPTDFCTGINHNITWIAFIAGTPNLSIDVSVSNCRRNFGLEVGIYESLDCEITRLVSNCDGSIQPNSTSRFIVNEDLVIGQYYYFVMDGNGGDECDYRVSVVDGSTSVGALEDINIIDGMTNTCLGDTAIYEVPFRLGANFQQWYLNDQLVHEQDTSFEMVWDTPGIFNLCYTAFNVCDTIPQVCKTIRVEPLPVLVFRDTLCQNGCYYFEILDSTICESGRTVLIEKLPNGCDQEYWIELEYLPTPSSELELEFCFGDSVRIGGNFYFETGNYQPTLTSEQGCDSIVNLSINAFLCDINGGFADDELGCEGDTDGQLQFTLLDGTFPYDYNWEEKTGTGLVGMGVSTTPGDLVIIDNLQVGIYSITVTDADNSRGVFVGQVFEPNPLVVTFETSDFNGFGVTCPGDNNGTINLVAEGGSGNFLYEWDDISANTASRTELEPGIYSVSITDNSGCEVVLFPEITVSEPIIPELFVAQPNCISENSGIINIESINGGAAPIEISLNNGSFSTETNFSNLPIDDYNLQIRDANGCLVSIDTLLSDPNDLTLAISGDEEIFLGDSILLSSIVNDPNVTYEWSGGPSISCIDCPETFIRPFQNSMYQLTILRDDECQQTANISIQVIDRKRIFFPSAFSPNNDGINDVFSIFGGPEVTQVLEFNVYGRWGEQIYKNENFQINNIGTSGWDGTFRGSLLETGVYAWFARVEFIDGVVEVFEGDVTLIR